jgi:ATP-dependent Clp protease ATP-binding subunit ClpX
MSENQIQQIHCNFCGKNRNEVDKLIVANDAGICNECITLCSNIINKENNDDIRKDKKISKAINPLKIKEFLDQYIIGQDAAKIALSVGVVNHYKRIFFESDVELEKSNILVFGPTGSGKTLLAKTIARYLNVPFVVADATTLTEAGYVGDDVESIVGSLLSAANNDVKLCEQGIIFLDEVDKIARKSEGASITRDVSGEGVQQALLKLVEGTKCHVSVAGGKKHPSLDQVEIDTSKILFIAGGAFADMDKIVQKRQRGTSIGFTEHTASQEFDRTQAIPEDFIKFGMIPEFCGRFPIMVSIDELSVDDFIRILKEPKNSLLAQMRFYFESDNLDLVFTEDAITAVAELAHEQHVGARGLKTILERTLMPYMYTMAEIKKQGFKQVEINADVVKNGAPPKFIE